MTDLEPGVQLTASTAAAMERLNESSSKPAMTKQHKATPEQWAQQALWVETYEDSSCIMELLHRIEALEACDKEDANCWSAVRASMHALRARVEILEATQHAHIDTSRLSDEERDQIRQDLARPARVFTTAVPRWPRPPHQDKLDRLIALDAADDGEPIVMPNSSASLTSSPAGSLVERLMDVLGHYGDGTVCAVILEVAAWLRGRNSRVAASVQIAGDLEKEAN